MILSANEIRLRDARMVCDCVRASTQYKLWRKKEICHRIRMNEQNPKTVRRQTYSWSGTKKWPIMPMLWPSSTSDSLPKSPFIALQNDKLECGRISNERCINKPKTMTFSAANLFVFYFFLFFTYYESLNIH